MLNLKIAMLDFSVLGTNAEPEEPICLTRTGAENYTVYRSGEDGITPIPMTIDPIVSEGLADGIMTTEMGGLFEFNALSILEEIHRSVERFRFFKQGPVDVSNACGPVSLKYTLSKDNRSFIEVLPPRDPGYFGLTHWGEGEQAFVQFFFYLVFEQYMVAMQQRNGGAPS